MKSRFKDTAFNKKEILKKDLADPRNRADDIDDVFGFCERALDYITELEEALGYIRKEGWHNFRDNGYEDKFFFDD